VGNFDRQLANALDKVHRELFGGNKSDCRWYYSGKLDIYHCPHTAIYGKDLMAMIPEWNSYMQKESNPAYEDWNNSPLREHTL